MSADPIAWTQVMPMVARTKPTGTPIATIAKKSSASMTYSVCACAPMSVLKKWNSSRPIATTAVEAAIVRHERPSSDKPARITNSTEPIVIGSVIHM